MINYNAHDIERYLNSKMNAAEMHAFEQAMMEDPLLADAVDGYRFASGKIDIQTDLAVLKERVDAYKRREGAVIKGSFRQWMSIAAGLVILLSASVVLYRIFNQTDKNNTAPIAELAKKDSSSIAKAQTTVDSTTVAVNNHQPSVVNPVAPAPVKQNKVIIKNGTKNSVAVNEPPVVTEQTTTSDVVVSSSDIKRREDLLSKIKDTEEKKQSNFVRLNKFSGVVVDENNQPLPFANVTEVKSGIGTYADVKGNFTLISSDTVLNIETKSVGYFSNSLQIRNNQTQRIVLKDEAVIANAPTRERLYEKNKDRPSVMKTEVTEMDSQPADGWKNYTTYIANNLRDADPNLKNQSNVLREVEVSFDVNPDGTLANLKIERSDCRSCNSEAIRIIKEGPKWKSKTGKKERTRFTVQF